LKGAGDKILRTPPGIDKFQTEVTSLRLENLSENKLSENHAVSVTAAQPSKEQKKKLKF
jgi:hypothetical protein